MGDLTIRNLDEDLVRRLETRAAANGRSLDEEIRAALERVAREEAARSEDADDEDRAHLGRMTALGTNGPRTQPTEEEIERRMAILDSVGRKPDEPFDLKAFSDELYDYLD